MIGNLAEQGMKVVTITVNRRSFSFSIVRLAITPGTPQPVAINMGINDLPDRPNLRNRRSMTNATRAMYPQSSKIAKQKNSTKICGKKPKPAPTPATMPSKISSCSHWATRSCSSQCAAVSGIQLPNNTSLTQSVPIVPIV